MENPLTMNDWPIKKFLIVVFSMQIAVWGAIGIDFIGIHVPLLRQLIVIIYLATIPGYLLLRVLRIHHLDSIQAISCAIGLSISLIYLIAFSLNQILPALSIHNQISILPILFSISGAVVILAVLSYVRDKEYQNLVFLNVGKLLSPINLFLVLLPTLAVFGAYLMNIYSNNSILISMLIGISLVVLLVAFGHANNISYPLAVFTIALSLVYHTSLISTHIWGWDICFEYYAANQVIQNSMLYLDVHGKVTAMLSVVGFAPICSLLANIDLTTLFKVVYPALFSFVPVVLYRIFQSQTNEKIAFLSTFFFVSMFVFYTEMLQLARQEIAELFFALILLVALVLEVSRVNKSILMIIFGFSLIVSHYGLSYIFMFMLVISLVVGVLTKNIKNLKNSLISKTYIPLLFVFSLSWYIYTSGSFNFESIVHIGSRILSHILDLFNPFTAQGLGILLSEPQSVVSPINKSLHIVTDFLICIGIIKLFYDNKKFKLEYILLALSSFFILIFALILPYFSSALNTTRVYQISLMILSLIAILGALFIYEIAIKINGFKRPLVYTQPIKIIGIFFVVFFLFNSGVIHQIVGEEPVSFALSNKAISAQFNDAEFSAASWLNKYKIWQPIYVETHFTPMWLLLGENDPVYSITQDTVNIITQNMPTNSNFYLYINSKSIENGQVVVREIHETLYTLHKMDLKEIIDGKERISDCGGARVYRSR